MKSKTVSVIIPVFNTIDFVGEAIESALSQDYSDIEVIVVDDGSTDGSYEYVKQKYSSNPKVKLLSHTNGENKGVGKSRKLALNHANGEYIAFLDADDKFLPGKIETQLNLLNSNDAILCHGGCKIIGEIEENSHSSKNIAQSKGELSIYNFQDRSDILKTNPISNSTAMVKTEYLKRIDFSSNQLFQYEDWVTWVLLSDFGKFIYSSDISVQYRYHRNSATYSVVNNKLTELYSKMEFILTLMSKLPNEHSLVPQLADAYKETLCCIIQSYSNSRDSVLAATKVVKITNQSSFLKLEELKTKQSVIVSELSYYQQSRLHRVLKRLVDYYRKS